MKSRSTMKAGDRFANLVFTGQKKNEDRRWLGEFVCDCGNVRFIRLDCVERGTYKSCGCKGHSTGYKERRAALGADYPFHILHTLFRKNAKTRKITFDLSLDNIKELFLKQNGQCVYTGKPIVPPTSFLRVFDPDVASIDRIDSKMGYTPDNVQLVTKTVNMMKMTLSHDVFLETCHAIVNHMVQF